LRVLFDKSFCFPKIFKPSENLPWVRIQRRKVSKETKLIIRDHDKDFFNDLIEFICTKLVQPTTQISFENFKDIVFSTSAFENMRKNGFWFREEIESALSTKLLLEYYKLLDYKLL